MKKRMELRIVVTFAIMFAVAVIINGIYSVVSMDSNFFTFKVMFSSMLAADLYLLLIWMNTRRHQLLAKIGTLAIGVTMVLLTASSDGLVNSFEGWAWRDTVMLIYCVIISIISVLQSYKLLEEDKETITVNIKLKGDITPEDLDVDMT